MSETQPAAKSGAWWKKAIPWVITLGCFAFLYTRMAGPAAAQGMNVPEYLGSVFASVSWTAWLMLMVPYSIFFFLIDSLIVWRVINWFNAKVAYKDIMPVRASTYVISILNEQVGKGAMALYLNKREGVPGWKLGAHHLRAARASGGVRSRRAGAERLYRSRVGVWRFVVERRRAR